MVLCSALTLLALALLLVAERRESSTGRALFKPLASTGFVAVAWAGHALDTSYGTAILAALALCWLGDVLLISARQSLFMAGLASFLAGHLVFCAAFVVLGVSFAATGWAAGALIVPGLLVARWLWPKLDASMRMPVAAYVVVITGMVALAIGTAATGKSPWIALGAGAFYISDISVAIDRFVRPGFSNRLWGLPLYYGAQLVLAWSVASG